MIALVGMFWLFGVLGVLAMVRDRVRADGVPLDRDERAVAFVIAAVWPLLLVAAGVVIVAVVIIRGINEAL